MDEQFERRRAAVRSLVRAAFARFAAEEGKPRFASRPDHQRWWRYGQEYFLSRQSDAWLMPDDLPNVGWLDRFPEMTEVRAAYAASTVLGARVDEPLGSTFSRQASNFFWILVQHVIEPIVVAAGSSTWTIRYSTRSTPRSSDVSPRSS